MDGEDLSDLQHRTREVANVLHSQATEILELTKRLEELTKDTPAWYTTTRARVEAGSS